MAFNEEDTYKGGLTYIRVYIPVVGLDKVVYPPRMNLPLRSYPYALKPFGPGTTPAQIIGNEMVELIVGPEENHHTVHRDFLCHKIPYFNKLLNGDFREANQTLVHFPEDDPVAFKFLIDWVYTGILSAPVLPIKIERQFSLEDIVSIYLLAEKFFAFRLQDQIVDYLQAELGVSLNLHKIVRLSDHVFVFKATHRTCKLRNLFMAHLAYVVIRATDKTGGDLPSHFTHHAIEEAVPDDNLEFYGEFAKASTFLRCKSYKRDCPKHPNNWSYTWGSPCAFHDHPNGSGCTRNYQGGSEDWQGCRCPVTDNLGYTWIDFIEKK